MAKYFRIDASKTLTTKWLKTEWRRIALTLHPDKGGDTEQFKMAQNEYNELLLIARADFTAEQDSPESYGNWDEFLWNISPRVLEAAHRIKPVVDSHGASMEACGMWLWVSATTPKMASDLKGVGLKWAPRKKQWFFNGQPWMGKNMSKKAIRDTFGSETYRAKKEERLAIA